MPQVRRIFSLHLDCVCFHHVTLVLQVVEVHPGSPKQNNICGNKTSCFHRGSNEQQSVFGNRKFSLNKLKDTKVHFELICGLAETDLANIYFGDWVWK